METQNDYNVYMQRAIDLAGLGDRQIQSNPRVGCVLVRENQIIGEGWHAVYGEGHAEVNAYNDAIGRGFVPDEKTFVYVTLEPCGHEGKTPPCANLLARFRPEKVYILQYDPNQLTHGKGPEILARAQVVFEFLENGTTVDLINRFRTNVVLKKAFFSLKYAETVDGFIGSNLSQLSISNVFSSRFVHKWRSENDAIMIGRQTMETDNPRLNLRYYPGRDPVKLIVSRTLDFDPSRFKVFVNGGRAIVLTTSNKTLPGVEVVQIQEWNWSSIRQVLYQQMGINSVLVEGGAVLLQSIIDAGEWDDIRKLTSSQSILGANIKSPVIKNASAVQSIQIASDSLTYFKPTKQT